MVFHPPLLYMGYVGFSVAFAFAIAALIGGRLDATWARWSRPVDDARLELPHLRHHARQLVGVLRARLGRLVVLGSGRERIVHAVAHRHGADPFAGGHGKARNVQGVDRAPRDLRLFAFAPRHVPRPVRGADIGSRLRHRSAPRRLHPRLPGARHRRLARALRAAGAEGGRRRPLRSRVARNDAPREQRPADRRRGFGPARHAVPAFPRRPQSRQDLRRPAVLRCGVRAADDAARIPDGRRAARAVEGGETARPLAAPEMGARRQRGHRAPRSVGSRQVDADGELRAAARDAGSSPRRSSTSGSAAAACAAAPSRTWRGSREATGG